MPMDRPSPRPRPSTAVLLALLAAVIALALWCNPAPHRRPSDPLAGLTYEARSAAGRTAATLVVTSVADRGPAAGAGIAVGDVIDRIDTASVGTTASIRKAVRRDGARGVLLHIRHGGISRYTYLPAARGIDPGTPHVAENTRRRG
jgi:hypothetical protein